MNPLRGYNPPKFRSKLNQAFRNASDALRNITGDL